MSIDLSMLKDLLRGHNVTDDALIARLVVGVQALRKRVAVLEAGKKP